MSYYDDDDFAAEYRRRDEEALDDALTERETQLDLEVARSAQSPPLVVNRPPVICDGHDVAMVRDEPLMGWRCPQGEGWFGDEDYYRLVSLIGSRRDVTAIRATGCGEGP